MLTDTVGFVRHLPHQLVKAFRSTLEEVADADLLIQVVDGSDANPLAQINAVRKVVNEVVAERDSVPRRSVGGQQDRRRGRSRTRAVAPCASRRGVPAPSRPFWITEYAQTASRISEAAVNLSGLLSRVRETLDSPSVTRLTPELEALLAGAEDRGRRWLYTAFALGCGLIVCAALAVIVTVWVLRTLRERPTLQK